MANSVDQDQTVHIGAVCSGPTLFVSILNSSVMLGNHLQQTTSTDDIFRCIFLGALRVKMYYSPCRLLLSSANSAHPDEIASHLNIHCLPLFYFWGFPRTQRV